MGILDKISAAFSERQPTEQERRQRLDTLTATAKRGLVAFAETGHALAEIQHDELWRLQSETWSQWCAVELGLTDRRAYQLIESAKTCQTLIESGAPMPSSERVARELAGLEPARAVQVWQQATAEAGTETPTAEAVAKIARKQRKPTKKPARPRTYRVAGSNVIVQPRKSGFVSRVVSLEQALVIARREEAEEAAQREAA